jgi:hypothetical protein
MRFVKLTSLEDRPIYVDAKRIAWFAPDEFRGTTCTIITMADLSGGKGEVFGPTNLRVKETPGQVLAHVSMGAM